MLMRKIAALLTPSWTEDEERRSGRKKCTGQNCEILAGADDVSKQTVRIIEFCVGIEAKSLG